MPKVGEREDAVPLLVLLRIHSAMELRAGGAAWGVEKLLAGGWSR